MCNIYRYMFFFVVSCLYSTVSLTLVREQRFKRMIYYSIISTTIKTENSALKGWSTTVLLVPLLRRRSLTRFRGWDINKRTLVTRAGPAGSALWLKPHLSQLRFHKLSLHLTTTTTWHLLTGGMRGQHSLNHASNKSTLPNLGTAYGNEFQPRWKGGKKIYKK